MSQTRWELTEANNTHIIDGISAENIPTITVGEEVTIEILLGQRDNHISTYNRLKKYEEHLTDKTLDYGLDYRGEPWYRFNLHPHATISSYLFEVTPPFYDGLFSFWGLLIEVSDNSTLPQANGKLELTFFVLARSSTYSTRSTLKNNLKAEL